MSRLQLLITQYRETEEVIKYLLDSIEFQQGIDLKNDIEVIIGNDGSDIKLTKEFLESYSYPIQYHFFNHIGLAGCRKNLFDVSTAPYIMFCDGDDMFSNIYALSIIFENIKNELDSLSCAFYAEKKNKDGKITQIIVDKDITHVHGKIYNRQFLIDNCIEWHSELHEHQDSAFNILAITLAKKRNNVSTPIYTWRYHDDSISNKNGKMHLCLTWSHLIDSADCLVDDFKLRGFGKYACYYAMFCLYSTYYEMTKKIWNEKENEQYRLNTYKRLASFYRKHKLLLHFITDEMIDQIIKNAKRVVDKELEIINLPPIEEWMQSILNLFL